MASGLSDIGIVAGATAPEEAEKLRAVLPAAPFLIPLWRTRGKAQNRPVPALSAIAWGI